MDNQFDERINAIVEDYRNNAKEYSEVMARVEAARKEILELEPRAKRLIAEVNDIRKREAELFGDMSKAGVDIEAFKADIEDKIKTIILNGKQNT